MQSVSINTNVVSSIPAHGEVYSIQHYLTGRWFSPVSCTNETDRQDIAEILLKVARNNITPYLQFLYTYRQCQILLSYKNNTRRTTDNINSNFIVVQILANLTSYRVHLSTSGNQTDNYRHDMHELLAKFS